MAIPKPIFDDLQKVKLKTNQTIVVGDQYSFFEVTIYDTMVGTINRALGNPTVKPVTMGYEWTVPVRFELLNVSGGAVSAIVHHFPEGWLEKVED